MRIGFSILAVSCVFLPALQGIDEAPIVSLSVPSGAPLRLYITKRISKRLGTPVEGKILEPVFAFDKEVVPAGSVVTGKVSQFEPVRKWLRFQAILNGSFTPLHSALVEFDSVTLPDGSKRELHTVPAIELNSIYTEPSKKPKKNQKAPKPQHQNGGVVGAAKAAAKTQTK